MGTVYEDARKWREHVESLKTPEEKAQECYRGGSAMPGETCEQRNMRMGWGCKCHGATFCPDLEFVGYEDDQPIFRHMGKLGSER